MLVKSVGLLAVISVALCLVPAGAHFFELANKMSMSPPEYMTVQKLYAGWFFFGIAIIAALLLTSGSIRTQSTPCSPLRRWWRSPPQRSSASAKLQSTSEAGASFAVGSMLAATNMGHDLVAAFERLAARQKQTSRQWSADVSTRCGNHPHAWRNPRRSRDPKG